MARTLDPKSKSGFIRSLPASMTAPEVVKAAKAKGITLSTQLVYSARAKKKGKAKAAPAATNHAAGGGEISIPFVKRGPGRPPKAVVVGSTGRDSSGLVAEIERIVEAKVNEILRMRFGALLG